MSDTGSKTMQDFCNEHLLAPFKVEIINWIVFNHVDYYVHNELNILILPLADSVVKQYLLDLSLNSLFESLGVYKLTSKNNISKNTVIHI